MLWELPESIRTVTEWMLMVAWNRKVCGESWPVAAWRDRWNIAGFSSGLWGSVSGNVMVGSSGMSLVVGDSRVSSSDNKAYSSFGDSVGSWSLSRSRNGLVLQRWPVWNRSSQLKHKPWLRRSCSSLGERQRIGIDLVDQAVCVAGLVILVV